MRYIEHVEAKFVKSDCRLLAFKAFSELKLLFSIESSHELLSFVFHLLYFCEWHVRSSQDLPTPMRGYRPPM